MEHIMIERGSSPSSIMMDDFSSPGLSDSLRTSSSSSTISSPRTSIFSLNEEVSATNNSSVHVKPKKKVSFRNPTEFFEFDPEACIRPDSPTLGWGAEVWPPQHGIYASLPILPKIPIPGSAVRLPLEGKMTPALTTATARAEFKNPFHNDARNTMTPTPNLVDESSIAHRDYDFERNNTPTSDAFDLECFVQTRNLSHLHAQLSELRGQICQHRAAVHELLLGASGETPITPIRVGKPIIDLQIQKPRPEWTTSPPASSRYPQSVESASRLKSNSYSSQRPACHLRTEIANYVSSMNHHFRRYRSSPTNSYEAQSPTDSHDPITPTETITTPPCTSTSNRGKSLRERIERLRESGWRRKRFDNRRYKDLREQVLNELEAI